MGIIDVKKNVTSRLNLEPIKTEDGTSYKFNGLVPARLVKIHITEQEYKKGEYEGKTLKVLTFEFINFKTDENAPDRFLTHTEKIVGTIKYENGEPVNRDEEMIAKNISDIWARVKHIFDQCYTSPNFRDISSVPNEDIKKYFDLPTLGNVDERLAKFNDFFEYLAAFANGDGKDLKPIYLAEDGSGVAMWLKLLPEYEQRNRYVIPTFVGQGFAEGVRVVGKSLVSPKIIKVKPSESLELSRGRAKATGEDSSLPVESGGESNLMDIVRGL